jgi:hypothetical protein
MRKGLVVTLGVVALVLLVTPTFALAPVISCIPDIIVSDAEQNQTVDQNFFIFSDALDLDQAVRDDDTSPKSLLKWSFVETAPGNSILINGISGLTAPTAATLKDPGASNLRAVSQFASVRNKLWSPVAGTLPFPNPGTASMNSTIQLVVSDTTNYTSQAVVVQSVNTGANASTDPNAQKDALVGQSQKSFTCASTQEGWSWYEQAAVYAAPTHALSGGALRMVESATQAPIVLGGWESSQDPTSGNSLKQRWGCVLRARFQLTSPNGQAAPGMRLRALWYRMTRSGSTWVPDFLNQDFNAVTETSILTLDPLYVPGREPGTTGKTYTLLYYPIQTDKLMTTSAATYLGCDLVDTDIYGNDSGEIGISQVDVDGLPHPEIGVGAKLNNAAPTAVAGLSFNGNFNGFTAGITKIATGASSTGLVFSASAARLSVTFAPGNQLYVVAFLSPAASAVRLDSGKYYRAAFYCTSSQVSGGNFGPTTRVGIISSRFVWWTTLTLDGGGLYSSLNTTPSPLEVWTEAPSPYPQASTQSEAMQVRWESYVLLSTSQLFNKQISGTNTCTKIVTESWPAVP